MRKGKHRKERGGRNKRGEVYKKIGDRGGEEGGEREGERKKKAEQV